MISVAISKRVITPTEPAPFCGYSRKEFSKGALDDIESNVILIRLKERDLVFITLDFLFVSSEFTTEIKERVNKEFNIPQENIIVSAIHTHSGPAVFKLPTTNELIGENYIRHITYEILDSIKESLAKVEPAKAVIKRGKIHGFYGNRNVKDGIYDDEGIVINFIDRNDNIITSFVNIACHPTILKADTLYFSSDLLGRIRRTLEKKWESPVMITNGACGDTSSRFFTKNAVYEEVINYGDSIANIIDQFDDVYQLELEDFTVECIYLPVEYSKNDSFIEYFFKKVNDDPDDNVIGVIPNKFAKGIIENKFKYGDYKYSLKSYIYTFKDLKIITIPGELVASLGLQIKEVSNNKNTIIIGYANDYVSYIIDEEQYGQYFEVLHTRMGKGKAEEFIDKILSKI